MARLICSTLCSLDGYSVDAQGGFGWAAPDDEVHAFVNDLERPIGTYLYGRRMYDTMAVWDAEPPADLPAVIHDYARIWQSADKVVYSTTLAEPRTRRTRIEPGFDPAAVGDLKAEAERDLSIGGPHLAAQAFAAGLVDDLQLFIAPVIVGGGTRALPDGVRMSLELVDERRFASGFVFLRYRSKDAR